MLLLARQPRERPVSLCIPSRRGFPERFPKEVSQRGLGHSGGAARCGEGEEASVTSSYRATRTGVRREEKTSDSNRQTVRPWGVCFHTIKDNAKYYDLIPHNPITQHSDK